MKQLFTLLLFALLLPACSSKDDDPATSALVGTWTGVSVRFQADYTSPTSHDYDYTDKLSGHTLTFKADQKITSTTPLSGTTTGTYSYSPPALTLRYPTHSVDQKVLDVKASRLIIEQVIKDPTGTFTTTTTLQR